MGLCKSHAHNVVWTFCNFMFPITDNCLRNYYARKYIRWINWTSQELIKYKHRYNFNVQIYGPSDECRSDKSSLVLVKAKIGLKLYTNLRLFSKPRLELGLRLCQLFGKCVISLWGFSQADRAKAQAVVLKTDLNCCSCIHQFGPRPFSLTYKNNTDSEFHSCVSERLCPLVGSVLFFVIEQCMHVRDGNPLFSNMWSNNTRTTYTVY